MHPKKVYLGHRDVQRRTSPLEGERREKKRRRKEKVVLGTTAILGGCKLCEHLVKLMTGWNETCICLSQLFALSQANRASRNLRATANRRQARSMVQCIRILLHESSSEGLRSPFFRNLSLVFVGWSQFVSIGCLSYWCARITSQVKSAHALETCRHCVVP